MDNIFNEDIQNGLHDMGLDEYLTNDLIIDKDISAIPTTIETLDLQFKLGNEIQKSHSQQLKSDIEQVNNGISNISTTTPIYITISDTTNQSQKTKNLNLFFKQSTLFKNLSIDQVVNDETISSIISNYMLYYYPHLIKTHGIDYIKYLHYISQKIEPNNEHRAIHFAMPHLRDNNIHNHVITSYRKTNPEKFWGYFCSDTLTPVYNGLFEKALLSNYLACQAIRTMLDKTIERQYRHRRRIQEQENNGSLTNTFINAYIDNKHEPIISYASCSVSGHNACTTLAGNGCYFNNVSIATSLLLKELVQSNYRCDNGNYQPHILILDLDAIQGNGSYQITNHWKETGYINDNVKYVSFQSDEIVEPYFLSHNTADPTKLRDIDHDYCLNNYSQYLPINLGINTSPSHNINIPHRIVDPNSDYYQNFIRYLTLFCHEAVNGFAPNFIIISLGINLKYSAVNTDIRIDTSKLFTKEQYMTIGNIIGDIFVNVPITVIQETLSDGEDETDKVLYFLRGLRCDTSDNIN